MTQPESSVDQQLLAHAERQTKALEDIRSATMFFTFLVVVGLVLGIAAAFG